MTRSEQIKQAAREVTAAYGAEKPILFSGEMVRAILDGRKTQTRRVIKPGLIHELRDGEVVPCLWECPYGGPGDRLWVREAFQPLSGETLFKADFPPFAIGPWKPSIFMPRNLSRITLEVVSVRVERLQEISFDDMHAEGIVPQHIGGSHELLKQKYVRPLWDNLNAERGYGWGKNPWVWVIEFRRLP